MQFEPILSTISIFRYKIRFVRQLLLPFSNLRFFLALQRQHNQTRPHQENLILLHRINCHPILAHFLFLFPCRSCRILSLILAVLYDVEDEDARRHVSTFKYIWRMNTVMRRYNNVNVCIIYLKWRESVSLKRDKCWGSVYQ